MFRPILPRYFHRSTGPGRWRQVAHTGEGPSPSAKVPDRTCAALDSEATASCDPRIHLANSKLLVMERRTTVQVVNTLQETTCLI